MNRREFIKTGLAFCGCVYLGVDIAVPKKGIEIIYPQSGEWDVVVNANGCTITEFWEFMKEHLKNDTTMMSISKTP